MRRLAEVLEPRQRVKFPLQSCEHDGGERALGGGSAVRAVATPDFAVHDCGSNRLFAQVVGRWQQERNRGDSWATRSRSILASAPREAKLPGF